MPPKKSRAAAAASQAISASQPLPETSTRPTRTSGRKRRHSDASNASDVSSIVSTTATEAKTSKRQKRGRGRPARESSPEIIIEEEEEVIEKHTAPAWPALPEAQATAGSQGEVERIEDEDEIAVLQTQTSERHVHSGGDLQQDDEYTTASNITPYPRSKMAIKRKTLSPSIGAGASVETGSKRFKTVSSRTSLPPSLSQEEYEPAKVEQSLQFVPMSEAIQERVNQIVAQRNALRNSGANGELMVIEEKVGQDVLVLDSQEEKNIARLPDTPKTPLLRLSKSFSNEELDSTPGRIMRAEWEAERRQFQDAILALSREADAAKSRLQVLDIELNAIGFDGGEESTIVLQSIRESFANVRDELEAHLPGTLPDGATNQDLLEILLANVVEFADRLRVADGELNEKSTLIASLGGQVDVLLTQIAMKTVEYDTLRSRFQALDQGIEEKTAAIVDIEESLEAMTEDRDIKQEQFEDEKERADKLAQEKVDFEASVIRLNEALRQYRDEETKLTNTVNRLETEHRETIMKMNKEREETVAELEDRLDEAEAAREAATTDADNLRPAVEALEVKVLDVTTARDDLQQQLDAMTKERDVEIEANEQAQADLEERDASIADLEGRVKRMEEELGDLNDELAKLRQLHAAEVRQREAAENDLDDRDQQLEDLNRKLHDQGTHANELRQKLFEVQQANDRKVKELEVIVVERKEEHKAELTKEVDAREAAEELAEGYVITIDQLKVQLADVEQQMATLLAERDARIVELEDALDAKEDVINGLRAELKAAEDDYTTRAQEDNERTQQLEASVVVLQETITQHENTIQTLEREALAADEEHESQTEERDAAIADLNAKVANLVEEADTLEREKANLEDRVTKEAISMLEMQNAKDEEIAELRKGLQDKQSKIIVVEEKARAADARWQDVLDAREEELATLRTTIETSTQEFASQGEVLEDVKSTFEAFVSRSSGVIDDLRRQIRELHGTAEKNGDAVLQEGARALEEVEEMIAQSAQSSSSRVVTTTTTQQEEIVQQSGGGRKGRGRKRVMDSGIGLD